MLAVYQATREAADRARSEGTPTLIEARTYRLGPHSTADDAGRYQPPEEIDEWKARDPVARFRRFLEAREVIDTEAVQRVEAEATEAMAALRDGVIGSDPRPPEELLEWVFDGDLPQHLARQRDEVLGGTGAGDG